MTGDPLEVCEPGRAPGGLWVRVTVGDDIYDEHPLDIAELVADQAAADRSLACRLATMHGECRVYLYDGDTGACVKTVIVTPE